MSHYSTTTDSIYTKISLFFTPNFRNISTNEETTAYDALKQESTRITQAYTKKLSDSASMRAFLGELSENQRSPLIKQITLDIKKIFMNLVEKNLDQLGRGIITILTSGLTFLILTACASILYTSLLNTSPILLGLSVLFIIAFAVAASFLGKASYTLNKLFSWFNKAFTNPSLLITNTETEQINTTIISAINNAADKKLELINAEPDFERAVKASLRCSKRKTLLGRAKDKTIDYINSITSESIRKFITDTYNIKSNPKAPKIRQTPQIKSLDLCRIDRLSSQFKETSRRSSSFTKR